MLTVNFSPSNKVNYLRLPNIIINVYYTDGPNCLRTKFKSHQLAKMANHMRPRHFTSPTPSRWVWSLPCSPDPPPQLSRTLWRTARQKWICCVTILLSEDLLKVLVLKVNSSQVAPEGDFFGVQPNSCLVVTDGLHTRHTISHITDTCFQIKKTLAKFLLL